MGAHYTGVNTVKAYLSWAHPQSSKKFCKIWQVTVITRSLSISKSIQCFGTFFNYSYLSFTTWFFFLWQLLNVDLTTYGINMNIFSLFQYVGHHLENIYDVDCNRKSVTRVTTWCKPKSHSFSNDEQADSMFPCICSVVGHR